MSALTHPSPANASASPSGAAEEPVTCELGYAPSDVIDALLRGAARLRRHLILTQELRSGRGRVRSITADGQSPTPETTPIRTAGTRWYYTDELHTAGSDADQR